MHEFFQSDVICVNFSSLLKLKSNDIKHATKSNLKLILSPLIYTFSENSRTHSSERLLKRSNWHAMDGAAPPVIDCQIIVGNYDGHMVIIFENKVKPSMIKGFHSTKICFNGKKHSG